MTDEQTPHQSSAGNRHLSPSSWGGDIEWEDGVEKPTPRLIAEAGAGPEEPPLAAEAPDKDSVEALQRAIADADEAYRAKKDTINETLERQVRAVHDDDMEAAMEATTQALVQEHSANILKTELNAKKRELLVMLGHDADSDHQEEDQEPDEGSHQAPAGGAEAEYPETFPDFLKQKIGPHVERLMKWADNKGYLSQSDEDLRLMIRGVAFGSAAKVLERLDGLMEGWNSPDVDTRRGLSLGWLASAMILPEFFAGRSKHPKRSASEPDPAPSEAEPTAGGSHTPTETTTHQPSGAAPAFEWGDRAPGATPETSARPETRTRISVIVDPEPEPRPQPARVVIEPEPEPQPQPEPKPATAETAEPRKWLPVSGDEVLVNEGGVVTRQKVRGVVRAELGEPPYDPLRVVVLEGGRRIYLHDLSPLTPEALAAARASEPEPGASAQPPSIPEAFGTPRGPVAQRPASRGGRLFGRLRKR